MSLTLSNQKNSYNALVLTKKRKIMFLYNFDSFIFHEGINSIFYKGFIRCYGKSNISYKFNKFNDSTRL